MSTENGNAPVIIIKRITESGEGGHHGGAWKVAYADFVTAMMAFFLLMWLLNATTEKQRAGLADYFSPTVVRTLSGSGGEGFKQGDTDGKVVDDAIPLPDPVDALAGQLQDELQGIGAESMQMKNLLRHVVTRVTDEGVVIEIGDLEGAPMFRPDTSEPTRTLVELTRIVARVAGRTRNQLAVYGYVQSYPAVLARTPVWELSNNRADQVRQLLEAAGTPAKRFSRITGFGDRLSQPSDPTAARNNRVEVILLK